jgi:hypothetical protein
MFTHKLVAITGGLVFLVIALVALYRLLFWFPITIGGEPVGQVASFFTLVIFAALSFALFTGARRSS